MGEQEREIRNGVTTRGPSADRGMRISIRAIDAHTVGIRATKPVRFSLSLSLSLSLSVVSVSMRAHPSSRRAREGEAWGCRRTPVCFGRSTPARDATLTTHQFTANGHQYW